ncbi:MAG: hypothetical protein U0132_17745 [Gemmatimonadaceae bacterium]
MTSRLGILQFLLPCAMSAQLPERHLASRPTAQLAESFSDIAGVRELSDGRLIVLDGQEQRLVLVDLGTKSVQAIGRTGQGPGEYGRAIRLVALPGDTTWVVDAAGSRILVIRPNGTTGEVITGFGVEQGDFGVTPVSLRAADGTGRLYFQGRGAPNSVQPTQPPDSVPIIRTDRRGGSVTHLFMAATPRARVQVTMEGKQIKAVNVVRPPFTVGDEWAVAADGTTSVARREPYRLDVVTETGSLVKGALVTAEAIPVTAADQSEYLSTQANGGKIDPKTISWPATKPTFLPNAVVLGRGGESWVRRTGRAGATVARYDVFDRRARLSATVTVPASIRIVVLSTRGAVVVRTDDDGLQYIERYGVPE